MQKLLWFLILRTSLRFWFARLQLIIGWYCKHSPINFPILDKRLMRVLILLSKNWRRKDIDISLVLQSWMWYNNNKYHVMAFVSVIWNKHKMNLTCKICLKDLSLTIIWVIRSVSCWLQVKFSSRLGNKNYLNEGLWRNGSVA